MAVSMQTIADRVGDLLIDKDHERWPVDELIRWANESLGAILSRRPAALSRRVVHPLQAGVYQTIPDGASLLLDVVRNIGADGVASGRPIRRSDRQQLDDIDPDWPMGTPKAEIKQYTYDDRVPDVFYVYPPAIAGTKVEILISGVTDDISAIGQSLDIGYEYVEPVVNYVCYRCHSKDFEYSNAAVAAAFYQAFEASLGIKNQMQATVSPNLPTTSV